jgi:protein-tyrosine phosphatase
LGYNKSAMIDCHCHMLPGIDDGARDLPYALEMARKAVANGITAVIVTPHHLNGVYDNPRKKILKAVMAFRTALAEAGINLEVYPGSELHLVPELPGRILEGDSLTYNDRGKAALVELPKQTIPTGAETVLERLLYEGITPIIAHPERNATLAAHPDRAAEWVKMGCKLQLTAQSCAGDFGRPIQNACRRWAEQGLVHLVASDAHRTGSRPPELARGIAALGRWIRTDSEPAYALANPKVLLNGLPLRDPSPGVRNHHKQAGWLRRIIGL